MDAESLRAGVQDLFNFKDPENTIGATNKLSGRSTNSQQYHRKFDGMVSFVLASLF